MMYAPKELRITVSVVSRQLPGNEIIICPSRRDVLLISPLPVPGNRAGIKFVSSKFLSFSHFFSFINSGLWLSFTPLDSELRMSFRLLIRLVLPLPFCILQVDAYSGPRGPRSVPVPAKGTVCVPRALTDNSLLKAELEDVRPQGPRVPLPPRAPGNTDERQQQYTGLTRVG